MRADRLVSVLLLMQARGRVTAAEVAAALEVSVATARRDLGALSTAGVPVYPQSGRGGGWSLVGGARTDLSGLTSAEARALFLLAGPGASVSPAARSALRKLVRALPETFRADAEAAATAVVLDARRWGEAPAERPVLLDDLESAVVRRRRVRLTYRAHGGEAGERLAEPLGLVDKDGTWYLLAGTSRGWRTYRVDRIIAVVTTDESFLPPPDFDLPGAWAEVAARIERTRSGVSATLTMPARLVPVFTAYLGRQYVEEVDADAGGGRARVRARSSTAEMLARQLAGWADDVEVEEPDGVRAELARFGTDLVRRYGG